MPANVVLGLGEHYTLEEAKEAHRLLVSLYREADPEMLSAVEEAYSILAERAEALARGEELAGMAVVAVKRSAAEVADYLLESGEESVIFARSRDGMPPYVSEARLSTAVVAPAL